MTDCLLTQCMSFSIVYQRQPKSLKELYDFYLDVFVDKDKKHKALSFEDWKKNNNGRTN